MALHQDDKPIFTPESPDEKNVERFRTAINQKRGLNLTDYRQLQEYSVHPETFQQFWQDVWDFVGIKASRLSKDVLRPNTLNMWPPPRFFPDARLNFAENVFAFKSPDKIALIGAREGGTEIEKITYGELQKRVEQMASAMRNAGIQKGDRIAAIISNSIVSFVICLATLSIGAIWSSSACDMGASGINDRLIQIRPKIIFADNGALYNRKVISQIHKLKQIMATVDSSLLSNLVIIPRIKTLPSMLDGFAKSITFDDFIKKSTGDPLKYEQVEFNHPAVIVYSSGTTGKPKCIVHHHGGYLIQMKKEHTFHGDSRPSDVQFGYTSTGWIMYNHQYGGLLVGATIILYDGSPFAPMNDALIKFLGSQKVTIWGTSPRFLAEIQSHGIVPKDVADLSSLRSMTTTGAVLTVAQNRWFYEAFPKGVSLASMSGGTDVMCCFAGAVPSWPLYPGEIQAKSLGMAVEVYSQSGSNDLEASGQPGELVDVVPFPSMPLHLWGDDTGEIYRKAYFNKFPGIWHHGDFLMVNPKTKGIIMLGRSDGVLNPSGVRFGSAEIYAIIEKFPQLQDAICVGQRRPHDQDENVLLFLKLQPDIKLTPQFTEQVKDAIRQGLSARHVPKYVFQVQDIPYTVNGKKVEIAVKQVVSGIPGVQVSGTVGNPEALEEYRQFVDVERIHKKRSRSAKL